MVMRLDVWLATEVLLIFQQAPFGVCGLLALPTIY
jgi:hypothetical protein